MVLKAVLEAMPARARAWACVSPARAPEPPAPRRWRATRAARWRPALGWPPRRQAVAGHPRQAVNCSRWGAVGPQSPRAWRTVPAAPPSQPHAPKEATARRAPSKRDSARPAPLAQRRTWKMRQSAPLANLAPSVASAPPRRRPVHRAPTPGHRTPGRALRANKARTCRAQRSIDLLH